MLLADRSILTGDVLGTATVFGYEGDLTISGSPVTGRVVVIQLEGQRGQLVMEEVTVTCQGRLLSALLIYLSR